MSKFNIDFIIW